MSRVACDAPIDVQVKIVKSQGAVTIGGVVVAAFIADLRLVYQSDKAVGKALGDEELLAVLKAQFNTNDRPKVGLVRRSTATSINRPRVQRTSFA